MTSVDQICQTYLITILKSDTQGHDYEVIKGREGMMAGGKIECALYEIIFSDLYEGLPRFDQAICFLLDRGFVFVGIYNNHVKKASPVGLMRFLFTAVVWIDSWPIVNCGLHTPFSQ